MTDFTVTKERSTVMTFSNPLDQIYHVVMIQNPVNTYNFEAYTSPLADITWLMLLLWILVTPPILFISARYILLKTLSYVFSHCNDHFLSMARSIILIKDFIQ